MSLTELHSETLKDAIPKSKVRANRYYLLSGPENEETIAYAYMRDGRYIFGFNSSDGGGLIALRDLHLETVIYPLKISFSRP